jgi:hypothetical protein
MKMYERTRAYGCKCATEQLCAGMNKRVGLLDTRAAVYQLSLSCAGECTCVYLNDLELQPSVLVGEGQL